jgi:hypothetical protein
MHKREGTTNDPQISQKQKNSKQRAVSGFAAAQCGKALPYRRAPSYFEAPPRMRRRSREILQHHGGKPEAYRRVLRHSRVARETRGAGDSRVQWRLSPASRAQQLLVALILGLTPQALCCRLLRRLGFMLTRAPRANQLRIY